MAEPQPSKLVMRVRFPSPAPTQNPRSNPGSSGRPTHHQDALPFLRARRVPDRLFVVPFRLDEANTSPIAAAIASKRDCLRRSMGSMGSMGWTAELRHT